MCSNEGHPRNTRVPLPKIGSAKRGCGGKRGAGGRRHRRRRGVGFNEHQMLYLRWESHSWELWWACDRCWNLCQTRCWSSLCLPEETEQSDSWRMTNHFRVLSCPPACFIAFVTPTSRRLGVLLAAKFDSRTQTVECLSDILTSNNLLEKKKKMIAVLFSSRSPSARWKCFTPRPLEFTALSWNQVE